MTDDDTETAADYVPTTGASEHALDADVRLVMAWVMDEDDAPAEVRGAAARLLNEVTL